MSAELLRRAAQKLREHANAATPGPWTGRRSKANTGVNWVVDGDESKPADHAWVALMMFGDDLQSDAEYIALMHPPVALALADLLDDLAAAGFLHPDALAVARAVLREPDPSGGATPTDLDSWRVRHPGIGVLTYPDEQAARTAAGTAGTVYAPGVNHRGGAT